MQLPVHNACVFKNKYIYMHYIYFFICFVIIVKYVQLTDDYQIHCNTFTVIFVYTRVGGATEPCTLKYKTQ